MTRDEFIGKWSTYLAGKFTRFAFCETSGPGLDARVRGMVTEIEATVAKMYSDANENHQRASTGTSTNAAPVRTVQPAGNGTARPASSPEPGIRTG